MPEGLQLDGDKLKTGSEVLRQITQFLPFSSISFLMTEGTHQALEEVRRLADWGMAKNKPKMKDAALEILDLILLVSPGHPVNLNLDEYQLSSLAEVLELSQRGLEDKKEGLRLT